jgi:hypothetical protein
MRRAMLTLAGLFALLACLGCSSPGAYWRDRGLDLLDTFEVGVSAGRGGRLELRYGLGVWGFGANRGWRARLGQRSFLVEEETGTWALLPLPLNAIAAGAWWLNLQASGEWEGGDGLEDMMVALLLGFSEEAETPAWRFPERTAQPPRWERRRGRSLLAAWGFPPGESFSIGAELSLLVGARVRLLPTQFLDFLTGIFGLDLLGDDLSPDEELPPGDGLSTPTPTRPKQTRMHLAAREGDLDALRDLIARGTDVNAQNARRETPLGVAVKAVQWEAAGLLMDHGATFSDAESPYLRFTLAAERGDLAGVKVLMRDELVQSDEKDSGYGLRAAAATGRMEVVRFLLESGVDVGLPDDEGRTALSCALQNGHAHVSELLRSRGAKE